MIKDVLVARYGVRVILTTHSPSTVALAPEGSIFEMSRTDPRIVPSPSKATTIGMLTSGLVVVSESSRMVLVEDELDVSFYEAIRDILSDYGPSRDARAIKSAPSLIFLPASRGTGANKTGGGSSVVTGWVNKFDQPPLNEVIRGIIDSDGQNVATNRIRVLSRYSIENYLLDPFVVFCLLLSANIAPTIAGLNIFPGDEHLIRAQDNSILQAIVDSISGMVEPHLGSITASEKALAPVSFTNSKIINYPTWMLTRRGHDLLPIFQKAFGGPSTITPQRLD